MAGGGRTPFDRIVGSDLFDPDWYEATYPDVSLLGLQPAEHFLRFGGLMSRAAGPRFGPDTHPKPYAEAARTGVNPLIVHEGARAAGKPEPPPRPARLPEAERRAAKARALRERDARRAEERTLAKARAKAERDALRAKERLAAKARAKEQRDARRAEERLAAKAREKAERDARLAQERLAAKARAKAERDARRAEQRLAAKARARAEKDQAPARRAATLRRFHEALAAQDHRAARAALDDLPAAKAEPLGRKLAEALLQRAPLALAVPDPEAVHLLLAAGAGLPGLGGLARVAALVEGSDAAGPLAPGDEALAEATLRRLGAPGRRGEPGFHRLLQASAAAFPGNAYALRAQAAALRLRRDYEGALRLARRLGRSGRATPSDLYHRFDMLNRLDRTEVTDRYVRRLRRARAGGDADPLRLAERFWCALRPAEGIEVLAEAGVAPDDPRAAAVRVRCLASLRRFREARDALAVAPDDPGHSATILRRVRAAVAYLDAQGIPTAPGEDAALAVAARWLEAARLAPPPPLLAVPRRVLVSSRSMGVGGAERQTKALVTTLAGDGEVESVHLLLHAEAKGRSYATSDLGPKAEVHLASDLGRDAHLPRDPFLRDVADHAEAFGLGAVASGLVALHALRPEVLHVRGSLHGEMTLAGALAGVPTTVIHFGSMTRGHQGTGSDMDRLREGLIERLCAMLAGRPGLRLVANSEAAAGDWARAMGLGPGAVGVIRNGLDLDRLGFARPPAPVVGGVFRLQPVKDPFLWIEVARLVADAVPDVRFLIVGDGPMQAAVRGRAQRAGLLDRLEMPGLVTGGLAEWYRRMDVFLLTTRTESLPNAVIEAQLAGLPVVAPDVGGMREAVAAPDTAILPERTPEALAEAVVAFLRDEDRRRDIRRRAPLIMRERFSLAAQLARTREAYGWD